MKNNIAKYLILFLLVGTGFSSVVYGASIYAGTGDDAGEVYKSDDGGATWTLSASSVTLGNVGIVCGIAKDTSGNVYAYVKNQDGSSRRLYKLASGSSVWQLIADTSTIGECSSSDSEGLVIDSAGNIYVGTDSDSKIYKSSNGGTTWTVVFSTSGGGVVADIHISKSGIIYAALRDNDGGGLWSSSDNGTTWTRIATPEELGMTSDGIPHWQIWHSYLMGSDSSGNLYVITFTSGVYKYTVSNSQLTKLRTLEQFGSGYIELPVIIVDSDDNIYVAQSAGSGEEGYGAVYKSSDNGTTWTTVIDTTTVIFSSTTAGVRSMDIDDNGNIYIGTQHPARIYKSTDKGQIWTLVASSETTSENFWRFSSICAKGPTSVTKTEEIDPDTAEEIVIITPAGEVKVEIPAGTFTEVVDAEVSVITQANIPAVPAEQQDKLKQTSVAIEIKLSKAIQPTKPITITMYYTNLTLTGFNDKHFTIAYYDDTSAKWVALPTTLYTSEKKLVGVITHLSKFQIMQAQPSATLNVKVYPNPLKLGSGTKFDRAKIAFEGLTTQYNLKIFTVAGELVFENEETGSNGRYEWDTANTNGTRVASGVYVYLVTNTAGEKAKGKIAIIK